MVTLTQRSAAQIREQLIRLLIEDHVTNYCFVIVSARGSPLETTHGGMVVKSDGSRELALKLAKDAARTDQAARITTTKTTSCSLGLPVRDANGDLLGAIAIVGDAHNDTLTNAIVAAGYHTLSNQ